MANMLEPGVFKLDDMGSLKTTGLVFFMHHKTPTAGAHTLDLMIQLAQEAARLLSADLLDEDLTPLTKTKATYIKTQLRVT
jgi:FtsZ-interacting cell division protein ZipA